MTNGQRIVGSTMRPNIQISHSLNGRVKDFAAENDMTTAEAYELVIKTGLGELEDQQDRSSY